MKVLIKCVTGQLKVKWGEEQGETFNKLLELGLKLSALRTEQCFAVCASSAVYTFHFKLHFTVDHAFLLFYLSVCTFNLSCY